MDLLELNRLLKLVSLSSKSVLFTKSGYFNLAAKFFAVNLLNYWVVIYLELSGILFSTSLNFVFKTVVVTNLLVFGILLSTSLIFVFKRAVVTKPLVSGNFLSTSPVFFLLNFVYLCCIDFCELT